MIPAILPPAGHALCWLPPGWDFGTPDPFAALLERGAADLCHLLVATPHDPLASAPVLSLPVPLARAPLASASLVVTGAEVPVYLSDRNYLSAAGDAPANRPFPGVLETAYTLTAALGGPSDPLAPIAGTELSDVTVKAASGEFDALLRCSWAGRELRILAGEEDASLTGFATVFRGTATGIRGGEETFALSLRSRLAALDRRVVRTRFAGTGGAEGPPALAGRPVPVAAGRLRQVPLVPLDRASQLYRVAERVSAVLAVRDRGLSGIDFAGDHPSYAALAAAAVPPGTYATCRALGLIRFGSAVAVPTADVDGDPEAGETARSILEWIVTRRLPASVRLSPADVDGEAMDALEAARPWRLGLYLADEATAAEALARPLRSVGAWVSTDRTGLLTAGLHGLPGAPDVTLTAAEVDEAGPSTAGGAAPVGRVVVGYRPMRRVLTEGEVSEAVAADDRAAFLAPHRLAEASRGVADRGAGEARVDTDLDEAADAVALAEHLASLLASATRRWAVPIRGLPFRYRLGQTVRLEYPRFGLDAGADYVVARIQESSDGDNSLELWGPPPNG